MFYDGFLCILGIHITKIICTVDFLCHIKTSVAIFHNFTSTGLGHSGSQRLILLSLH